MADSLLDYTVNGYASSGNVSPELSFLKSFILAVPI